MNGFRDRQIGLLASSGWTVPSIRALVAAHGLPEISTAYLETAFDEIAWQRAESSVEALRAHFAGARFADEVGYGVLLVPDPSILDTRMPVPAAARADQLAKPAEDVFDARLPPGTLGVPPGNPWTMVGTVIGEHGPAMGSHNEVNAAVADTFTVHGVDTRKLMIRQLWGARVLQCGSTPPDCEVNGHWTFTLFPGEPLTDGQAESGTVLKGKVRFRLGKPDRGIGSARVAPAIRIDPV